MKSVREMKRIVKRAKKAMLATPRQRELYLQICDALCVTPADDYILWTRSLMSRALDNSLTELRVIHSTRSPSLEDQLMRVALKHHDWGLDFGADSMADYLSTDYGEEDW